MMRGRDRGRRELGRRELAAAEIVSDPYKDLAGRFWAKGGAFGREGPGRVRVGMDGFSGTVGEAKGGKGVGVVTVRFAAASRSQSLRLEGPPAQEARETPAKTCPAG
jgi:hypothetical protein